MNKVYILLSIVIWSFSIDYVVGAQINFNKRNRQKPDVEDMEVIASEDAPEMPRKDLVRLIQTNQFFQDIFSEQPDPLMIQFGHVCENPSEWEQRFEKRDFNNNHYQGKMKWGNKNGDYGEHYWDLGHAG